jgi:hypothetical protein
VNIGGSLSPSSQQRACPGSAHPPQKSSSRQRHVVTSTHISNIKIDLSLIGFVYGKPAGSHRLAGFPI